MKKEKKLYFLWKAAVIVLLIAFPITSTGCSSSKEVKNAQDETIAQTAETTTKPETTTAVEQTAQEETTPTKEQTTQKETTGSKDADGRYLADNKYILAYLGKFNKVAKEMKLSFDMDLYTFTDNNITPTEQGRLSNVGLYTEDNQVMVGLGYNMDDEDMWYTSFEAPLPGLSDWFEKYYFASTFALCNNPIPMGDTEKEVTEFMDVLFDALVSDGKDKAIQIDEYVFVFKNTSKNRAVFAVDTLSYFNTYHKGEIELISIE